MPTRRVSPQEAHDLVQNEGYVYVDVRSVPEFDQGHPTGAYNVPLAHMGPGGMQPNHEFLAVFQRHFAVESKLVIGCKSGGRSARACVALEQAGYVVLVDQRAGYEGAANPFGQLVEPGWSRVGLPVAHGPDPERGWHALKK